MTRKSAQKSLSSYLLCLLLFENVFSLSLHRLNTGNHISKLLQGQFICEVWPHQRWADRALRDIGGLYCRRYSGNIIDRYLSIEV